MFRIYLIMDLRFITLSILLVTIFTSGGCKSNSGKAGAVRSPAYDSTISIHEAALNGQISLVLKALSQGTDVNFIDQDGRTALMYAAFNGHTGLVKALLEKGATVDLQDMNGRTALMMAASGPYPETVRLLLSHNADPDLTDSQEHFTALMYAASEGQLENVKILVSHGADPGKKDIDGDDALTFASDNGHKEIVALLLALRK